MKSKLFLLFSIIPFFAYASLPSGAEIQLQRLFTQLQDIEHKLQSHQVEIDLFHERVTRCEEKTQPNNKEKEGHQKTSFDLQLAALEQRQQTLIGDLKSLKNQLESLLDIQKRVTNLEKQVDGQMKELKSSLQKVLALLQPSEGSENYQVKAGDSLGQIAIDHKTSVRKLKEINHLDSDQIYPGQKLRLP